ncbi:MAG: hypothetical protein IKZ46_07105 [Victivallales bacterium]|nr:hypothetical protein [Victivallales bacterium]
MTLQISTQSLSEFISSKFGYPASCSYDVGENMYLMNVFMVPSNKKNEIEDQVYDISDDLNLFMVVFVFTEEETRKYYPDKVPKASIAPQMILSQAAQ